MVYDGSKSGLNKCLYAPWFALPTIDSMLGTLEQGFWCCDNNIGEHFLTFPMHQELQRYCGVDVTQIYPDLARDGGKSLGYGVIMPWAYHLLLICRARALLG